MTRSEILQIAKPILFNTEMVRAILDGRKTETRRVIKPQPNDLYFREKALLPVEKVYCDQGWYGRELKAPYKPGCYLYVRETWAKMGIDVDSIFFERSESLANGEIIYKSDGWDLNDIGRWHPSIHMPKEAARIFLRVTDVRVERLHRITGRECVKEGIPESSLLEMGNEFTIGQFHDLWDSTVKPKDRDKYGWVANPWVFVIEFERAEVTE